eukprot:6204876-Pleurochrysis_carterae.AAC.3
MYARGFPRDIGSDASSLGPAVSCSATLPSPAGLLTRLFRLASCLRCKHPTQLLDCPPKTQRTQ